MTFISYAQNCEDVILWRALNTVYNGFYIDVGAWDPRNDSVTLAFYERGWRGINIEPDLEKARKLVAARQNDVTLQVALADTLGQQIFYVFPETGWSTLDTQIAHRHIAAGAEHHEISVKTMRLDAVCDHYAPRDIHFLKLDVEGAEALVLAGADFKRHRPWILVVEATVPDSNTLNHHAWEGIVLGAGYKFAYFDGINMYYVAEEKAAMLMPKFATPPNILDDFVSVAMLRKSGAVHDLLRTEPELDTSSPVVQHDTASAAEAVAPITPQPAAASLDVSASIATSVRRRVVYDAGLLLYFGLKPPVGIVRVEQYLAELLAHESSIDLEFVTFDRDLKVYRPLEANERTLLETVIFHRYRAQEKSLDATMVDDAVDVLQIVDPSATLGMAIVAKMHSSSISRESESSAVVKILDRIAVRVEKLQRKLVSRKRLDKTRKRIAARWARVRHRVLGEKARFGRLSKHKIAKTYRVMAESVFGEERAGSTSADVLRAPASQINDEAVVAIAGEFAFAPGDTLITIANTWDYMDYAYLARIVRRGGVRLISVIYDVIAMEMPFTTPGPVHIYHRHWVELGHLATHLVAISRHSVDTYKRFIAEPNSLNPPITYAYLPNFLYERREEIGEKVVSSLLGQRFVVYCSTIETRKNHQLLLHLWERLRTEIDEKTLPILVLVGSWGWGTETVALLCERNWRLRKRLMVLSAISDAELIWLYRNACFTVFPALSEGFGLASAESLSFGTPVIVANCPALIEATEGLMPALDPLDLPSWVAEVRRAILDETYLARLRSRAGQYKGAAYHTFGYAIRDAILDGTDPAVDYRYDEETDGV